ncbi:helix-turn-helix transcriptional regulator [Spirulina sp. CS-785/01]|uniref:helix-turn-helix domain-containing protein n=1 Tax=Spirulina sp. CS-785/01 TaxID=3021716 RepID=UPI00232D505B|nr:helix-turn-helix transcriptional regulator [Spirulina sp. CS-785/01]MDB9313956.1 helix-turn-helix transcriptional regulator [Spirulina sp. CS-785/01]
MSLESLKTKLLSDPTVKEHYEAIQPEFEAAKAIIAMRRKLALTQRELAEKAGIKQPQLARLETGKQSPRLETLAEIAASVGYAVEIKLVPLDSSEDNSFSELK